MRIAICLSGQPRFLSRCISSLKTKLIEPNNADVFIHTWWDETIVGKKNDTSIHYQKQLVGTVDEDVPQLLKTIYPIDIMIDKPIDFSYLNLRDAPTAKGDSISSNFYSQWKSIQLKKQYENKQGFIYDIVVRARLDLYYEKVVKLEDVKFDQNQLVLASIWQNKRQVDIPGLGDYTMDDNIVISNSGNIDKYGEVFSNLKTMNEHIHPPFAENYLGWNCKKLYDLEVITHDLDVEIMQRIIHNFRS